MLRTSYSYLAIVLSTVLVATAALAQDDEAPRVAGPEDVPGADVIWLADQPYLLNATGSTDNVGIVGYRWEIVAPSGASVNLTSTTPTKMWTPTTPGLYKVTTWAADAADNEGGRLFVIDVAEVLSPAVISGGSVTYDHSVAVTTGTLSYVGTDIDITGGLARDPPSYPTGEMISDGLRFNGLSDGSLAGEWGPYSSSYGYVYEETSRVLVGKASISNVGGTANYGFTYTFDKVEDLSKYHHIEAWFLQDYTNGRYNYAEFYDESGKYLRVNPPTSSFYPQTGLWYGVTVSFDITHVSYIQYYGITDLTQVKSIKFRYYGYKDVVLIDGVTFSMATPRDNMTESTTPSGPFGGSWTGWTASNAKSYVGTASIYRRYTANAQTLPLTYTWTSPVDLTPFNALRMYTWYFTGLTSTVYVRTTSMLYIDADGNTAFLQPTYLPYMHYSESDKYSAWAMASLPFDRSAFTLMGAMDWTRVASMTFQLQGSRPGDFYIDGLEFYSSARFKPSPPGLGENLAHGIYVMPSATLSMDGVDLAPTGPFGGFVMAMGTLDISDSTISDLWGTTHQAIPLDGATWGGVLSLGGSVVLDGVTVQGTRSTAFCLVNSNVLASDVTVAGAGRDFPGACAFAIIYQGTDSAASLSATLRHFKLSGTVQGAGLGIVAVDALGDLAVNMDGLNSSGNAMQGARLLLAGTMGTFSLDMDRCLLEDNGAAGLGVSASKVNCSLASFIDITVVDSEMDANQGDGLLLETAMSVLDLGLSVSTTDLHDNLGNGMALWVVDSTGRLEVSLDNASLSDNTADGAYALIKVRSFTMAGESISPDMTVSIAMADCVLDGNAGWGMREFITTESTGNRPPFPHHSYSLTADRVTMMNNTGGGYLIEESKLDNDRDASYTIRDSRLDGNGGCGLLLVESASSKTVVRNAFEFISTSFNDNARGIEHQIGLAFSTSLSLRSCVITGSDAEALYVRPISTTQRYTSVAYDVRDTQLDDPVRLTLDGAMVEPGVTDTTECAASVVIRDCTLSSDFPLSLVLGAQYTSTHMTNNKYLFPFRATVELSGNTVVSGSRSDGVRVEMWGPAALEGRVVVEDMSFVSPGYDGVSILMGVRATVPDQNRMIYGSVTIANVSVLNPGRNGITVAARTVGDMYAVRGVLCRLTDVSVGGALIGARFEGVDAEVTGCAFSGIVLTTVQADDCTVDLRDTVFGAIGEPNLKAMDAGRIRLWFDLGVRVLWKDSTDPVVGARVELIDNAYRTFGFGEVGGAEEVYFKDLNALTIVAAGVYTNNPYRVSTSYLGLVEEMLVEISSDTVVTVALVDDVPPILNLRVPVDGTSQSTSTILVGGTAYDMHRLIDHVLVSLDGVTWTAAEGTEAFTCTLVGVPDGPAIVRVRAYDTAGNWDEAIVSVLVDTTPPALRLMSPSADLTTNDPVLRLLAVTETGARVLVGDTPVALDGTVIDHTVTLVEGRNTIVVSVSDSLGNTRELSVTVTLDTLPPLVSIVTPAQWSSVRASPAHLVGLTEPGVATVLVAGAGVTVDGHGRFVADVAITPGRNDVSIRAVDAAGNLAVATLTIILDQEPPALVVLEPMPGSWVATGHLTVKGFVEPGCTVIVGNAAAVVTDGTFSVDVSLPDGRHTVVVTAMDAAGNSRTIELPVTVDTTPPSLELTSPADGLLTNVGTLTIRGSVVGESPGSVTVTVGGQAVTVAQDGTFELTIALAEWTNRIIVGARDAAGNVATVELRVTLDNAPPFLALGAMDLEVDAATGAAFTREGTVRVTGFAEVGSTVTVNGVAVGLDPVTGAFGIELKLPPLQGGSPSTMTVRVVAIDAAGNTQTLTRTIERREPVEVQASGSDAAGWGALVAAIVVIVVGLLLLARARGGPGAPIGRPEGAGEWEETDAPDGGDGR